MTSSADRLLADLDPLPYPARQEHVARLARELAGRPELDGLLTDLLAGGPWERRLSLQVAAVAGDRRHVRRCLTAPGTALPMAALGPAVRLGVEADVVLALLPAMPAAVRRVLRRAVRRHRATGLADALLPVLRERYGDREAAALLPDCSDATVARHLPDLAYAVPSWRALARRHPARFLDHAERTLAEDPPSTWGDRLARWAPALAAAGLSDPDRLLDLLDRCVADVDLGRLSSIIAALARHAPQRVLDLLLDPRRRAGSAAGRSLLEALGTLDEAQLCRLARSLEGGELHRCLRRLAPARRPPVYAAAVRERDLAQARVGFGVLDLLPDEARYAEAQRLLDLPGARDQRWLRLRLMARCPWAEAEPVLREAATGPLAEDRALAYPLLVGAAWATRDPAVLAGLVDSFDRLRNEQEPVRTAALQAVARHRPELLADPTADRLVDLLAAALQARDSSIQAQGVVERLGDRLVQAGVETGRPPLLRAGLRTWGLAGDHAAALQLAGRAGHLPAGVRPWVHRALRPRLDAEEREGRFDVLLRLAWSWGRDGWDDADLQDRLGRACGASSDRVVRAAVELWLAPPASRDARVAVVLRADSSTATIPAVSLAVASRRTDLLDQILTGPQQGRLARPGVFVVPAVDGCAGRWLPRQVDHYRSLLVELVDRPGEPPYHRAAALRRLGRLPGSGAVVRRHLDHPVTELADAALELLPWDEDPSSAVPDLVDRTGGDRAHVAASALARAARFVPPEQLVGALSRVFDGAKVTARKQVAHVLARLHAPGTADLLAAEGRRPGQHRDVRRALVSALREVLADDVAWVALAEAVTRPDVATAVLQVPPEQLAPAHRGRYAALVLTAAESVEREVAVPALQALAGWVRWAPAGGAVALARYTLADVDDADPSRWRAGLDVLLAATLAADPGALVAGVERLLTAHDARDRVDFDAGERDLPARQRLDVLAGRLADELPRDPGSLEPVARRLVALLAPRDLLVDLAVRLAVAAVPWDRAEAVPRALADVVSLCGGRSDLGLQAGHAAGPALGRRLGRLPADLPVGWVWGLLPAADPAAAMLALLLTAELGAGSGWTPRLREALRRLRSDADPVVRLAAARTVTTYE